MKMPRPFLQLAGTGLLLSAVLLALGLTAPPQQAGQVKSGSKQVTTAGSISHHDRTSTVGRHGNTAPARSDSSASPASHPSGEMSRVAFLESELGPASSVLKMDEDTSFRDPIVSGFRELETLRLRAVDPSLAGHSLAAFGRRAAVEESAQVSGTTGVMLTLSVDPITSTPDEGSPDSSGTAQPETSPYHEMAKGPQPISSWQGLSYEQQLFRTKWGWQAFDQVQKVLREQQGP